MIYIEYMEHDRSIPMEMFRSKKDHLKWPEPDFDSDDHPVAVLGRTLSLGPHPPYLTIWRCRTLEKLDEWDAYFKARRSLHAAASHNAIHLSHAGCYNEVIEGPPIEGGIQYIEYFRYGMTHSQSAIEKGFADRVELYENGSLNFVLCRMGPLGPDPGGLAIWSFPSHADIEKIVLDQKHRKSIYIISAGLYRKLGEESA